MPRRIILAMAATALLATLGVSALPTAAQAAAEKVELSNKWRIKVEGKADSDGAVVFRVTPRDQASTEVTVPVQKGSSDNQVAKAIEAAFLLALPKEGFKAERDDGEDVLLRKDGNTPNFTLEIVSSTALNVRLNLKKE